MLSVWKITKVADHGKWCYIAFRPGHTAIDVTDELKRWSEFLPPMSEMVDRPT